MAGNFAYEEHHIKDLKHGISKERMSTYLKAANGDEVKALDLYLWNSEISSAFYIPLQGLEVAIRNTIHSALTRKFKTEEWYDVIRLNYEAERMITAAQDKVRKLHGKIDAPHVIAELSLGFWTSLLNKEYHQTLWIPALGKAFPHAGKTRSEIHGNLFHLRLFRNRIAHYEPIFSRDLKRDYESIRKVIGWINPTKASWIERNNRVIEVLSRKPLL